MFEKVKKFFDNKNITNKYFIKEIEDLFKVKKINFYLVLLKYILKKPIFIYQIYFLIKIRNNIIHIIKSNYQISNKNLNERIEEILTIFTDSKYYITKLKVNNDKSTMNNSLERNKEKSEKLDIIKNENVQNFPINNSILSSSSKISYNESENAQNNSDNRKNQNILNNSNKTSRKNNLISNIKNSSNETDVIPVNDDINKFTLSDIMPVNLVINIDKKNNYKYFTKFINIE